MPRWVVSVKGVLLWNDGVVLVHNERNEWELPGGQLEEHETPEQCVAREIEEELSLAATVDALIDVWVYDVLPGQRVLMIVFGCQAERPPVLRHSKEHDDVALVSVNELDDVRLPEGYKNSIRQWVKQLADRLL